MKKSMFLAAFLLAVIFLAPDTHALSCTTRLDNCMGGETAIFRFNDTSSSFSGGHAALWDQTSYANVVCCSQPADTLYRDCDRPGSETVLNLTAADNSHVQLKAAVPYSDSYGVQVCLSALSTATFDCQAGYFGSDCSTGLPAGYKCLASVNETASLLVYSNTNAHVGNCTAYIKKLCCLAGPPAVVPPVIPSSIITCTTSDEIRVPLGGIGRMVCKIKNPLNTSDNIEITSTGNPVKLHNWIWFDGHRYDENKNGITLELGSGEERAVAIDIYGGEIISGSISLSAKSLQTGFESVLSPPQAINIIYSEDGMNVKTPEIGWLAFLTIALMGALLV